MHRPISCYGVRAARDGILGRRLSILFLKHQLLHGSVARALATRGALAFGILSFAVPTFGLPTGGSVVAGSATISSSGASTVVSQTSANAIINWQGFSIGSGEVTKFIQPSATSAILNRVTGSDPSLLLGSLQSNGQVYLLNPNGVVVGQGASIDAGGFTASTLDVSNAAFLAGGALHFSGQSNAAISNLGAISASQGNVYLVAQQVSNSGSIQAPNGTVGLAAGTEVTLTENGTEHVLVSAADTSGPANGAAAAVVNSGTIHAAQAELKAEGGNLYALAINNTGVVRATGAASVGGHIYLTADGAVDEDGSLSANGSGSGKGGLVVVTGKTVDVQSGASVSANGGSTGGTVLIGGDRSGGSVPSNDFSAAPVANATDTTVAAGAKISADGGTGNGGNVVVWSEGTTDFDGTISAQGGSGETGGFAEVSGHQLLNFKGTVNLLAPSGSVGTLLLDPENVVISNGSTTGGSISGGNFTPTTDNSVINATTLETALGLANVTINTGMAGSQNGNITIATPMEYWNTPPGQSTLTLTAAGSIFIAAPILIPYGQNLVLNFSTTGGNNLFFSLGAGNVFTGSVQYSNDIDTLTMNGTAYTLLNSPYDFGMFFDGTQNYALVNAYSYPGYGITTPFAHSIIGGTFSGTFNGMGNTIMGLNLVSSDGSVGFFNNITGTVRDLGFSGASVTNSGSGLTGILAGESTGTIFDCQVAGTVTVTGVGGEAGGLVGNNSGTITNSLSSATVSDTTGNASDESFIGGLVGFNQGGFVSHSYASGAVSNDGGLSTVGGLVGENLASVTISYASGTVSNTGDFSNVGGLIGKNSASGTLTNAYESGLVTNSGAFSSVGAVVGNYASLDGSIGTDVYWDATVNSTLQGAGTGGAIAGGQGLSTGTLKSGILPLGFSNTNWNGNLQNYPTLGWEAPLNSNLLGTVYDGFGSTNPLSGAVVSGYDNGVSLAGLSDPTGSNGNYSFQANKVVPLSTAGTEVLVYIAGGGAGYALYDAPASLNGLNLYANTVYLSSGATNQSGLVGQLSLALTGSSGTFSNLSDLQGELATLSLPALPSNYSVSIAASGAFDFDQPVALNGSGTGGNNLAITTGGAINEDGSGALTVVGTSSFSAGANAITLSGTNAFTGAVSVSNSGSNDASIKSTGDLVLGTTDVGGDGNLILTVGGALSQTGPVTAGGLMLLEDGTSASLTNSSNVIYNLAGATNGPLTLTDSVALSVDHREAFDGFSSGPGIPVTINDGSNLLQIVSPIYVDGAITLTADSMTIIAQVGGEGPGEGAASTVTLAASSEGRAVTVGNGSSGLVLDPTTLNQIRATNVVINPSGSNVGQTTVNAFDGNSTFASGTLTLGGSGSVAIEGPLSLAGGLSVPGGTDFAGGSVTTFGGQTYGGPVILDLGTTLAATSGPIAFASTIDGPMDSLPDLTVNAGSGAITVSGAIGASAGLGAVSFATTGLTTLGGSVGVAGEVPPVGSVSGATSLSISGPAALNGGAYVTSGGGEAVAQNYSGAVTLGADTVFQDNSGKNIVFDSTLDGARALTVLTDGTTAFGGTVGGITPLASLVTSGIHSSVDGSTDLSADVTTTGQQVYGNSAKLAGDVTLATSGGAVSFYSTLDNLEADADTPFALTVNSATAISFDGVVGGLDPLGAVVLHSTVGKYLGAAFTAASLSTQSLGGMTELNGGPVTTTGGQTYGDATVLMADTTLRAGGAVDFISTLDSFGSTPRALTVDATGNITLEGAAGGANPLGDVVLESPGIKTLAAAFTGASLFTDNDVSGTTALDGGSVVTTGTQEYDDITILGADTTLTTTNSNITFGSTLNSAGPTPEALTVSSGAGAITLSGTVGGTNPLGAVVLTTSSVGGIAFPTFTASSLDLHAGGAVTQTGTDAMTITGATSATTAPGSGVFLNSPGNDFSTLAFSGHGIFIEDKNNLTLEASTATASIVVQAGTGLTVAGPISAYSVIGLTSLTGDVTINHGGKLTLNPTDGAGGVIDIYAGSSIAAGTASGGDFVNDEGADAFSTPSGGYWNIYTGDLPGSGTVLGGLTPTTWRYNFGTTYIPSTTNQVFYRDAPTLSISAGDQSGTYGTAPHLNQTDYILSGEVDGNGVAVDTPGQALGGTLSLTTGATASSSVAGGPYSLVVGMGTATNPHNYNLHVSFGQYVVDPAVLTAGLTGTVTKVYDGTTDATLRPDSNDSEVPGNYTLTGIVGADDVTLNDPTSGTYSVADVGTGLNVTVSGLALGGAKAGDYVLASTTVAADIGTITPATLTATLTGTADKVYDTTTAATLDAGNYSLSGVVGSDDVTLNDPTTGTYATKDPGTGINVSVTGLDLSGSKAGDYILAGTALLAPIGTITPATLTYTSNPATAVDGTTVFPVFTGTVTGFVGNETLSGATTGTLVFTTPATSHSPPGSFAINGSGLSATDYKFVQAPSNSTAFTLTGSFVPEDEAADTASRIPSSFSWDTETFTKIHRFSVHYETRFDYGGKTDPLSEGSLGYASSYTTFAPGH